MSSRLRSAVLWAAAVLLGLAGPSAEGASEKGPSEKAAESAESSRPLPIPLHAEQPHHNFGLLFDGEQLEHAYEVTNTSSKPVRIREVRPDCVCTTVDDTRLTREIAPGASGKIAIKFDTTKLKPGAMKETIEVFYDDNADNPLVLELQGIVKRLLFFRPQDPRAEAICGGDKRPQPTTTMVSSVVGKSLEFVSVEAVNGLVHARYTNDPKGGNRAFLRLVPRTDIDCLPKVVQEVLLAEVVVDENIYTLHIPVDVVLRSRIQITPLRTAYFTTKATQPLKDGEGGPVEKTFDLRSVNKPAAPFKVLSAKTQSDKIRALIKEVDPGLHWQITVRVEALPPADVRRVNDVVEIRTDDAFAPVLYLPVTARF